MASMLANVQVANLFRVGFVEVMASPWRSSATHSDSDGHEIEDRPSLLGTRLITFQVAKEPSVGSSEVRTRPLSSTAAQNVVVGHEMPARVPAFGSLEGSMVTTVHVGAGSVGSLEMTTAPASIAAQNVVD